MKDCNFSEAEMNTCGSQEGSHICKEGVPTSDFCYQQTDKERQDNEIKTSRFRIIFYLLVALIVVNINFKDKLIYYAIITGALIPMIAGITAVYGMLKLSLFPIVTTVKILFALLIYNTILTKTKQADKNKK